MLHLIAPHIMNLIGKRQQTSCLKLKRILTRLSSNTKAFDSFLTTTIRNILRNGVLHHLWATKIEIWRIHIFVLWIFFYKQCNLVTGSVCFPCGCSEVRIQLREIFSQHQFSLKTYWCLWDIRLVNDPSPSGIILDISRIITRNIRFSVAIKRFLNQFTSDLFKLFLCINQPPFKAFVTLRSI